MAKVVLEIPSEIVDAVRLPPAEIEAELLKELALALYRRGVLSLGKARALAQMDRWQFESLLDERRIPRHFAAADLEEDIRHALDVPAVSTDLTTAEILALVREGRRPRKVDEEALAVRQSAPTRRGRNPRGKP